MGKPIHVGEDVFEATVLQSPVPVLVTFWAPWCPACRSVVPGLDEVARDYAGRLLVAKVDTDKYPDLAGRYGAGRIPTLVFMARGHVVHQEIGVISAGELRQRIDSFLAAGEPEETARDGQN